MKASDLKRRLQKNRPMASISMRLPEDIIDDLKRIAPQLGFSGYQPLIRAYIGRGLRDDLERLQASHGSLENFVARLKQRGVDDAIIQEALADLS